MTTEQSSHFVHGGIHALYWARMPLQLSSCAAKLKRLSNRGQPKVGMKMRPTKLLIFGSPKKLLNDPP
jgi:hypothetical protein